MGPDGQKPHGGCPVTIAHGALDHFVDGCDFAQLAPQADALDQRAAGIHARQTVGQGCVLDPWYSLGTGDMLDVAFMGMHVAQMTHPAEMARCFEMVTQTNARIMNLEGYGLKVGDLASLVVIDADNPTEALRLRPDRLFVVSRGKVIVERERNDARLAIAGRPGSVRRRFGG